MEVKLEHMEAARRLARRKVMIERLRECGAPPPLLERVQRSYEEALAEVRRLNVDRRLLYVCEALERYERERERELERSLLGWLSDAFLYLSAEGYPYRGVRLSPPKDSPLEDEEWREFLSLLDAIAERVGDRKLMSDFLFFINLLLGACMVELQSEGFLSYLASVGMSEELLKELYE